MNGTGRVEKLEKEVHLLKLEKKNSDRQRAMQVCFISTPEPFVGVVNVVDAVVSDGGSGGGSGGCGGVVVVHIFLI